MNKAAVAVSWLVALVGGIIILGAFAALQSGGCWALLCALCASGAAARSRHVCEKQRAAGPAPRSLYGFGFPLAALALPLPSCPALIPPAHPPAHAACAAADTPAEVNDAAKPYRLAW